MKKFISLGIIFFIGLMSLGGCTANKKYEGEAVSLGEVSKKAVPVELYIKEAVKLGKDEPVSGAYLGAYVQDHKDLPLDITRFEELVDYKQVFNVMQYTPEKGLSSKDILKCMAQRKIPYIKVLLDKNSDLTPLYRLIADLNASYKVPIFVELFPVTGTVNDPTLYKNLYHRGYALLQKYIKDVTVVWSMDDARIYDMSFYYPGDDYVDWAGINVYIPRYKQGISYDFNSLDDIDFWYKSFQKSKPMLISSLAISQFSRVDHTYKIKDVQNKLDLFYKEFPILYPRIKGILYIDVDLGEVRAGGMDDYRISNQKELSDHLKVIFKHSNFLKDIEEQTESLTSMQYMKYSVIASEIGGDLYLDKNEVKSFFKQVPLSKISVREDLEGNKFYKLDDMKVYTDLYYERKSR